MEAPNIIFIPIVEEEDKRLFCTIWWEHDRKSDDKFVKETIKYIRKDALLEWAESLRKTHLPGQTVIRYLIDKLNSM